MSEKLKIDSQEARELLWGEGPEGIEIVYDRIIDNRRWSIDHEIIVKKDGRFYRDIYSVGATESQDESPWEYSAPDFTEVFPVEKTVIVYEERK